MTLKFQIYRIWWWLKTGDWINGNEPYVSPSQPPSQWDIPSIPSESWSASPSDEYETGLELYLDLSTGHVSYPDWKKLQEWDEDSPLRVLHHRYGLIMWVPVDQEADQFDTLPESVRHIAVYAQKSGCGLINFDQDAQVVRGLDYYEW